MKKKTLALLMALTLVMTAFAGCGKKADDASSDAEETTVDAAEDDEENYDTGDASLDNIRNQDEIGDKEILVVSFGTSYNDSRRLTIGAIEDAIEDAIEVAAPGEFSVRRGFTSQIIIDHVERRDGILIDNLEAALDRAVDNGVKELVIQPTHLMNGLEYDEITEAVAQYSDAFEKISIGDPLLTTDEDFDAVADAIFTATAEYNDGKTAICFMGHGTEAESNQVYAKMQQVLKAKGLNNYYIGTVEAEPSLEDVIEAVKEGGYERVVLRPLMVVAGDHANNDMAGDDEDSWKSAFEAEGYDVICVVEGLGQLPEIQGRYVVHALDAMLAL